MTAQKEVTYTPEVTAELVQGYTAILDETYETRKAFVDAFAQELGVKPASVIGKLSREGIYKAKEYVTKTGKAVDSKADKIARIAARIGMDVELVGSLEKATVAVLDAIEANLK